jgi:glucose/arabinose dehydrogenase
MKHRVRREGRRDNDARPDELTALGARAFAPRAWGLAGANRLAVSRVLRSGVLVALLTHAGPLLAAVQVPTDFVDEVVTGGLGRTNGMAFLPDGRLLVTEQLTARVRLIVGGHVAARDPCVVVSDVSAAGTERGLQGIAVDPRWPASPYVYVCYTRLGLHEAIVRFTASGDLSDPAGEDLALSAPLDLIGNLQDRAANHNGGGLRFGIDGMLYVGLGEDSDPCSAQHPDSLRGVLLRLDVSRLPADSGGPVPRALLVPPDNPLSGPDSNARLVYAYGLRNPWRFHVDPATGSIVLADVGEIMEEEIDEILPGRNYGWPFREGYRAHIVSGCVEPPGSAFEPPRRSLVHDGNPFLAILTAGVYRPVPGAASNWPREYWGDVFYGDYFDSRLRRIRPSEGWADVPPVAGQPGTSDWATGMTNVVDFAIGPDGSLWWLQATNDAGDPGSGAVHRIRYAGPTVSVPATGRALGPASAWPNPFRATVHLGAGPGAGQVARVRVLDLQGREVWRTEGGAATSSVEWDGRDATGRSVPAGLYLVRVRVGRVERTVRVLRLR